MFKFLKEKLKSFRKKVDELESEEKEEKARVGVKEKIKPDDAADALLR